MALIILIAVLAGYFLVGLILCFIEVRKDISDSLTDDDLVMCLIAWPMLLLDAIASFIVMSVFFLVHKIREIAKRKNKLHK